MDVEPRDVLYRLFNNITLANEGLDFFSPTVDKQLNLFQSSDQTEEFDQGSLGFSIARKLEDLNSYYLHETMKLGMLDKFLSKMDKRYTYSEGKISSNMKKSGTFNDLDRKELSKDEIMAMSDLEILSQINAYQNPYSKHKIGRSSYEHFFGALISFLFKPVTEFSKESEEFIRFQVLHNTTFVLHLISQNAISIIEIVMTIIKIVNIRIKTSGLSIRMDLRLPEFKNPIMDNSMENFENESKIYEAFRNKEFRDRISKLSDDNDTWLSKIEKLNDNLGSILETSLLQTSMIFSDVVNLKNMLVKCKDSYVEIEMYLSDLMLFIMEFQDFIEQFIKNYNGYSKFYKNVHKVLKELETLEEEYPTVYGGYTTPSPRTPRNQPSARQNVKTRAIRSNSRSRESSPVASPHKSQIIPVKPKRDSIDILLDLSKVVSSKE